MQDLEIAIQADINQDYVNAVEYYERHIGGNSKPSEEAFINLAFLYWRFVWSSPCDFDFSIPLELAETAFRRYPEVIELCKKLYPQNAEMQLWEKYFLDITDGIILTENDCLTIISAGPKSTSTVAAFFLLVFRPHEYEKERLLLIKQCIELPIAKNLYIKSCI